MAGEDRFWWVTLYHIADNYPEVPSKSIKLHVKNFIAALSSLTSQKRASCLLSKEQLASLESATESTSALKEWLDEISNHASATLNVAVERLSDPKRWGPYYWNTIDAVVESYPIHPEFEQIKAMKSLFASLGAVLPCDQCAIE